MSFAFQELKVTNTYASASPGQNIPVDMPDTVNVGDYLFVFICQPSLNVCSSTPPAGWTFAASDTGRYYKVADGTEGGTTVNFITSNTTAFGVTPRGVICLAARYQFDQTVQSIVVADGLFNFQFSMSAAATTVSKTFTQLNDNTHYRLFLSLVEGQVDRPTPDPDVLTSYSYTGFDRDLGGGLLHFPSTGATFTGFSVALLEAVNVKPSPSPALAATINGPLDTTFISGTYRHLVMNFNVAVDNTVSQSSDVLSTVATLDHDLIIGIEEDQHHAKLHDLAGPDHVGGFFVKSAVHPVITDSDFITSPDNGTVAMTYDTSNGQKLWWVRAGGTWDRVEVTD